MRKKLIILSCLISLNLISQEDSVKRRSCQIGVLYTADYVNKGSYDYKIYRGTYASSVGFNFTKRIKKKIRLDAGIQFSTYKYIQKDLTFLSSINLQTGSIDTFYTANYKYQFIEIPIKFNYFILQKDKLNIYLIAGVYPSFYIRHSYQFDANPITGGIIKGDEHILKSTPSQLVNICSALGFGFEYKFIPNLSCTFQPELRTNYLYTQLNYNLFRIGANVGLRYNL